MTTPTEVYVLKLKPLLDRGAISILLNKGDSEVLFIGNESYKHILQTMLSFTLQTKSRISKEYISELTRRGIRLDFGEVDFYLLNFSMMNLKVYLATYGDVLISCVFANNFPSVNEFIDIVRDLTTTKDIGKHGINKEEIKNLKALILSARRSASSGIKEELLRNLNDIREFLERLQDQALEPYLASIKRVLLILEQKTEITDELKLKLRRILLLLLKSISKRFKEEI
ncbi:MAG: hypothetical protein NDP13_04830 [Crenarchaeota archaeon]|nr:hypothetical protein [Thermoproteota archaeon]MCR8454295.1 hypothetical protein [Thermoproteota archaeon]MCR8463356.1 hypothetical protein [Thermoproteota archaeon]MCR8470803.1 hypothetical protein [Thermoproteota archaeon]MCR8472111.1 hypothetical protein [Thermoproteota archaeon]